MIRIKNASLCLGAIVVLCLCVFYSCTSVKPFEKAYLSEPEMQLSTSELERFENNMHTYREGASGASGGKAGGGCGCY